MYMCNYYRQYKLVVSRKLSYIFYIEAKHALFKSLLNKL